MFARALTPYRLAAILLLLAVGTGLAACSLMLPPGCELAGLSDPREPGASSADHHCLCCCRHIVLVARVVFGPAMLAGIAPPPTLPAHALTLPDHIDHPPRA